MKPVDETKLGDFVNKVVADWGALASAPLVRIGDQLGLYRAMADGEPVTSAELAARTRTTERYVREWLAAQAAGGYVTYDGAGHYHLEPEQAMALTDENSPAFVLGGFETFLSAIRIEPRLTEAFRDGSGIGWHEHDPGLFGGTARFFRPGYAAHISEWLLALDDVSDTLHKGGRVADVGCGFGHSTVLMAKDYPNAAFVGYDYHAESVDAARKLAAEAGVKDRVSFRTASAKEFDGKDFDLIAYDDCLHDMGDPVGALRHARAALAPGGSVMLVEPFAQDELVGNLNPLGRLLYSASTLLCTPSSRAQEVGAALGAQAGEARLRQVADEAGFGRFRRAAETPFNLVFEAKE
jgi:SAM-dependent methyltransferase